MGRGGRSDEDVFEGGLRVMGNGAGARLVYRGGGVGVTGEAVAVLVFRCFRIEGLVGAVSMQEKYIGYSSLHSSHDLEEYIPDLGRVLRELPELPVPGAEVGAVLVATAGLELLDE